MAKCQSCCQIACTTFYFATWCTLLVALAFYHVSLLTVVPEMQDFPDNLRSGIDKELGFARLEADATAVKNASKAGMAECQASYLTMATDSEVILTCQRGWSGSSSYYSAYNEPPATSLATIRSAFNNSLAMIQRVTNDKHLGTSSMSNTARELNIITVELDKMQQELEEDEGSVPCSGAVESFCTMFVNAEKIVDGVGTVNAEIDRWTGSEWVDTYEEAADYFVFLHAAPYLVVIGAFFFSCAWCQETCCKDGTCFLTSVFLCTWTIFFLIQTVIFGLCLAMMHFLDEFETGDDLFVGNPSIQVLVDHIKENYPSFWNEVFTDLEDGLIVFYYAATLFELWTILIISYVCCYCCMPYGDEPEKALA